jgi:hypothetical protein
VVEYPRDSARRANGLPRFDPNVSADAGVRILRAAGVPFALAGRVAVWTYVPAEGQGFTKDVDFAVPYGYAQAIEEEARRAGYATSRLSIGGVGVRKGEISVDFIDRHPGAAKLFADAVAVAEKSGERVRVGEGELPVVPKQYLLAMKMVPHEEKDERDAQEILKTMTADEYRQARRLVEEYLGYVDAEHLDSLARRIGHAGVEPRYGK